jgi:hypothetical protein
MLTVKTHLAAAVALLVGEITPKSILRLLLDQALTTVRADTVTEGEKPRRVAQQDRLISVAILLVHDHVDDWVDAGAEIDHDVTEDVETRPVHLFVEDFGDGDGQIARDKRQENRENHFCDAPLVALLLCLAFVFQFCRFCQVKAIAIRDVVLDQSRIANFWYLLSLPRHLKSLIVRHDVLGGRMSSHSLLGSD